MRLTKDGQKSQSFWLLGINFCFKSESRTQLEVTHLSNQSALSQFFIQICYWVLLPLTSMKPMHYFSKNKTKKKKTVFTQILRGVGTSLLNLSFHRILFRDHQNSAACLEKQQLCFLDEPQGQTTSYHFLPSCRFPANHSLKCYAILLFRKQYMDLDFIEYRHHFIPFY